jgi:hypothetical protein
MDKDKVRINQLRKAGRKPKKDPAVFRYSVSFNAAQHAQFLALFEQSGMRTKAHFIVKRIFDEPFKVIHIDKPTVDYYGRLTTFYAQFRAIGVNYNQVVKAINQHLTPKKALAFLYKLEKATLELVAVTRKVVALTKEFEEKYIKINSDKIES